jgi:hypothetical protein
MAESLLEREEDQNHTPLMVSKESFGLIEIMVRWQDTWVL